MESRYREKMLDGTREKWFELKGDVRVTEVRVIEGLLYNNEILTVILNPKLSLFLLNVMEMKF